MQNMEAYFLKKECGLLDVWFMKQANTKRNMLRAGMVVVAMGLVGRAEVAHAAAVYVNHSDVTYTPTQTVAGFKYRFSNTNFDMSLDNGNSSASANMITSDLGNISQLSTRSYLFEIRNIAGEGLIFKLMNQATGAVSTQAWGTFSSPTGASGNQLRANLNGILPDRSFNSLFFEARSTATNSSFTFSNLDFTSDGVSELGDGFLGGTINPTTGLGGSSAGFAHQRLVSDFDLSEVNFTLTGVLSGMRTGTTGDETLKFTVFAQQGDAVIPASLYVPEPGTVGMCLSVLGGVCMLRKRA
jgi:hypothetical protein